MIYFHNKKVLLKKVFVSQKYRHNQPKPPDSCENIQLPRSHLLQLPQLFSPGQGLFSSTTTASKPEILGLTVQNRGRDSMIAKLRSANFESVREGGALAESTSNCC